MCHSFGVSIACHTAAEPDANALVAWLGRPELLAADGRVLSWISPAQDGYPYDEATVLLARLWRWMGIPADALIQRIEARLASGGWLGRNGIGYSFDTALALPLIAEPAPLAEQLASAIAARQVCDPAPQPDWWSQSFGAHLLKVAPLLAAHGQADFAEQLASELVDACFDGERFHIHGRSPATYVHSHCYALEGLLGLGGLGMPDHPEVLRAGADWLVGIQHGDGSFPAWAFGPADGRRPSDVVAQAIRIWTLLDPDRYAPGIERALAHLSSVQDRASGGLRYDPRSPHLTSWVGVFAAQALRWAAEPPSADARRWLI